MRELLKRSALALTLLAGLGLQAVARAEKVETGTTTHKIEPVAAEHDEHERPLLNFQPAEAIWIVIIFTVLLVVLYKTAWKNVLGGLKAREERIRKDIADAEASRMKSEASLKEYNAQLATAEQKVREMLQSAVAEGERISTQIKMQAQQESEAAKDRATKDIETAKKQAIQEIYAEAANLSTNIAEKILRRSLLVASENSLATNNYSKHGNHKQLFPPRPVVRPGPA
jgi:F-type H+-transporting ATPase subunit b